MTTGGLFVSAAVVAATFAAFPQPTVYHPSRITSFLKGTSPANAWWSRRLRASSRSPTVVGEPHARRFRVARQDPAARRLPWHGNSRPSTALSPALPLSQDLVVGQEFSC